MEAIDASQWFVSATFGVKKAMQARKVQHRTDAIAKRQSANSIGMAAWIDIEVPPNRWFRLLLPGMKRIRRERHYPHVGCSAHGEGGPSPHSRAASTRPQGASRPRVGHAPSVPDIRDAPALQGEPRGGKALGQLIEASPKDVLRPGPVFLWKARQRPAEKGLERHVFNSRAVEFIAQAGMSAQLRNSIEGPVLKFLEKQRGFAGAAVLTTHKEPRRVLVLTFWRTERDCLQNEWELADQVQHTVGTLIDALSRVQTYKAEIWQPLETGQAIDAAQPC